MGGALVTPYMIQRLHPSDRDHAALKSDGRWTIVDGQTGGPALVEGLVVTRMSSELARQWLERLSGEAVTLPP